MNINIEGILIASGVLGGIGLVFGILLAISSRIFHVEEDERIEKVLNALPGANCGGCGFSGCSAYATAIVENDSEINLCPSIDKENFKKIEDIMGKKAELKVPKKAWVLCAGEVQKTTTKYNYVGDMSCHSAIILGGGDKQCKNACLGYGSCTKVCPTGAITIKYSVAHIDSEKCIGCGRCERECPKSVIDLIPIDKKAVVKCSCTDLGRYTNSYCSVGCIACKLCVKACEEGAIEVINNVAQIDYDKCTSCKKCIEVCPRKIIYLNDVN